MTGTSRESDKFMLRLPEGMRERIKVVADENGRSMNAEIVAALKRSFPQRDTPEQVVAKLLINLSLNDEKTLEEAVKLLTKYAQEDRIGSMVSDRYKLWEIANPAAEPEEND